MGIPKHSAGNGEDDIKARRDPSTSPKESVRHTGVDVSERCLRRWHYFLALMQFWKDKTTPFQYGGIVRYNSKVMLYIMFRLKAILKSVDFQFHHYVVKNTTTWGEYAR